MDDITTSRGQKRPRIWLASVGERPNSSTDPQERAGRMSLLAEAIEKAGGDVVWWSSAFDHTQKRIVTPRGTRYRIGSHQEVILTNAPGYARNVSVQRLVFNFRTAREFAQRAVGEPKPDLILTSYPPIELVSKIATYGNRNGIPTIADIRDLWPDVWLDAAPAVARPLAKMSLSPYFALSRASLASVTAICGITDEFVTWGLARAGRQANRFDRSFSFGYSLPSVTSEEAALVDRFWNERLNTGTDRPSLRLCLMGKMGERTGHDHVIEAVRSLPPHAKAQVQLVICGADLRQATAKYGNDSSIVFAGWVDQPKLVALMNRSDIGVIPYRNSIDYQNSLSNKMIEYLAGGVALTTGIDGKIRRLIDENDCGYFYPDQDTDAYRALLLQILANKPALERRKQAARAVYEARFRGDAIYTAFATHLLALAAAGRDA